MKIREVIQEFIPCEVCGNHDIAKFYFHVIVHKGTQPFVKCQECENEYYSTRAKRTMTRAIDEYHRNLGIKRPFQTNPLIDEEYCRPRTEITPIAKILLGL